MRRATNYMLGRITFALAILAGVAGAEVKAPVTTGTREILAGRHKFVVAAAEAMPDNKYGFKPTPQQISFGETVAHVAEYNFRVCSLLAGAGAKKNVPSEEDGKARLVASLRESFEFCSGVLSKMDDSVLGQTVQLYGPTSKGKALLYLTGHLADHYTGMAMYLRLNGILPPSAQQ